MSFKKLSLSTAIVLALYGCGGSDDKVVVEDPIVTVPEVPTVEPTAITLEEIMPNISTSEPIKYVVDLPEDVVMCQFVYEHKR